MTWNKQNSTLTWTLISIWHRDKKQQQQSKTKTVTSNETQYFQSKKFWLHLFFSSFFNFFGWLHNAQCMLFGPKVEKKIIWNKMHELILLSALSHNARTNVPWAEKKIWGSSNDTKLQMIKLHKNVLDSEYSFVETFVLKVGRAKLWWKKKTTNKLYQFCHFNWI